MNGNPLLDGLQQRFGQGEDWTGYLRRLEQERALPQGMLSAIEGVETAPGWDPARRNTATSPKGARGRFQFMPETAARFGVTDPTDPYQAARGAADYLQANTRYLADHGIEPTPQNLLASYNAGEGAVTKYGGVPPFPETQGYVQKAGAMLMGQAEAATPPANPLLAGLQARYGGSQAPGNPLLAGLREHLGPSPGDEQALAARMDAESGLTPNEPPPTWWDKLKGGAAEVAGMVSEALPFGGASQAGEVAPVGVTKVAPVAPPAAPAAPQVAPGFEGLPSMTAAPGDTPGFWERVAAAFGAHRGLDQNVLSLLYQHMLGGQRIDPATGAPLSAEDLRQLGEGYRSWAAQRNAIPGPQSLGEYVADFLGTAGKEMVQPTAIATAPIGGNAAGLGAHR